MVDEADTGKEAAWAAARAADDRWGEALGAHRLAPPDANFASRLAELAAAAKAQAAGIAQSAAAGLEWAPVRGSKRSKPPYELRGGTGRRGPVELWERFDSAVAELNEAGGGDDVDRVAAAFAAVGDVAEELAARVGEGDTASSR